MAFGIELLDGPLLITLLIGIFTTFVFYLYLTRNHSFWKNKGIPQPKSYPFLGTTLDAFTRTLHEVELERYKKLGPIYGCYEGNKLAISVADPKLLRDIFVKDFNNFPMRRDLAFNNAIIDKMLSVMNGDDWKRVRSIVTPTFTTGKIKRMFSIFEDCTQTLLQNFKKASETGKPVDCKKLFGAFSMDVIASSAFSTKLDSHNDPENEFVNAARGVFSPKVSWRSLVFIASPAFARLIRMDIFDPKPMEFFKKVTLQIIEERQRLGKGRNDFLQLLLDTAKEVLDEESSKSAEKDRGDVTGIYGDNGINSQIFKNVTSKNLSIDELVAQCVIFFLAGYDTTGSTLTFIAYFLALNPDVQEKLRAEVDEAYQNSEGKLTYEAVQNMKYLDGVIAEALRLFPPLPRLERTSINEYTLGDTGITIPKGTVVTIPNIAIQRDSKFFPDAEKFDPDRWSPEERAKRDMYTYLPFGAGPRNCVGMRFALMEMKICIAHLMRQVKIHRCPETKVPIEFHVSQALLNSKEVMIEVELRKDI